jgi:hypothetical protein
LFCVYGNVQKASDAAMTKRIEEIEQDMVCAHANALRSIEA